MGLAVPQSKMEHCQSLSHAGGGSQRKQPHGSGTFAATFFIDLISYHIQFGVRCRIPAQLRKMVFQILKHLIRIQRWHTVPFQIDWIIIRCRHAVVGIHQTGKQHPGIQHIRDTIRRKNLAVFDFWEGKVRKIRLKSEECSRKRICTAQRRQLSAGTAVSVLTLECLHQRIHQSIHRHQSMVMSLHSFQNGAVLFSQDLTFLRFQKVQYHSTGKRMINILHRTIQYPLKCRAILPEIVEQPCNPCCIGHTDFLTKCTG